MPKKLTQETFINRAIDLHKGAYSYELVDYKNAKTPVLITCSSHSSFAQSPDLHLRGGGCPKCKGLYKTVDERIEEANFIHHNTYTYKSATGGKTSDRVSIVCTKHGEFNQAWNNHIKLKQGCPKCASEKQGTLRSLDSADDFIQRCRLKHSNKYDYSKTLYKRAKQKVIINCPSHGDFRQTPASHLNGNGCPRCAGIKTNAEWIEAFTDTHGERYEYSKVSVRNANSKIKIVCKEHGLFLQTPSMHKNSKQGCPKCAINCSKTWDQVLNLCKGIHGDKYDYSKVSYLNIDTKIEIICPKHGSFKQRPSQHTRMQQGCPKCSNHYSKPHKKVVVFLESLGFIEGEDFQINIRGILKSRQLLELDVYFPSREIAIEVDGVWAHQKGQAPERDVVKNRLCLEQGINLLRLSDLEINKSWPETSTKILEFLK